MKIEEEIIKKNSFQKISPTKVFDLFKVIAGIYVSFIALGYFQERITKVPYNSQYFDFPLFIVFINCLGSIFVALLQIKFFPSSTKRLKNIPYGLFISSSFFLRSCNVDLIFSFNLCKLPNTSFG